MSFEKFMKMFKSGMAILTFVGVFIGGVLSAGEWYGAKKTEFQNIRKDVNTNKTNCEEVRKETNQHMSDTNKRLERIEEMVGKVVEYVWQGEGQKCKTLSKRRKMPKKKRESQKKRNDTLQLKVYAID